MTAGCDTCRRPGSCCGGFVLSLPSLEAGPGWRQEALAQVRERGIDYFEPMYPKVYAHDDTRVLPVWRCTRLGTDGRCTDYEGRPQLCRLYKPGQDELCVEYVHRFKGIPITWGHA